MERRSFLKFLGIGPSVVAVAAKQPQRQEPKIAPLTQKEYTELITDALVICGVLAPGQCASQSELDLGMREIKRIEVTNPSVYRLATRMCPYYGIQYGPGDGPQQWMDIDRMTARMPIGV